MKTLQSVGLTKTESEIYTLLVKSGDLPASRIIKETKYHPQIVYRALDSLSEKRLVFVFEQNSKKYFRAEDPKKLIEIEEVKMQDLRGVVAKLQSLSSLSQDAVVKVFRGNEEIVRLRKGAYEALKKNEVYYIIGASGERFYEIVKDSYESLEKKRIKKGIKKKMIVYESQKKEFLKNDQFLDLVEMRFLKEDLRVPTSTNIFGNTVAILVWEYNPIVIIIESRSVAESYKQYFEILWKSAKQSFCV